MPTDQLTYTGHLVATTCWCGIRLAVPEALHGWAQGDTDNHIYCPLGHQFVYRESEADRLRAQLDQAQADARFQRSRRERADQERRDAEARATAALAETERTRRRLAGGACPCCNRTFTNLARHMSGQHPDYATAPQMPVDFARWSRLSAVVEVVGRAGEPLTDEQVFGRMVIAGRRSDTQQQVAAALYNAHHRGQVRRVARRTWAPPIAPSVDG